MQIVRIIYIVLYKTLSVGTAEHVSKRRRFARAANTHSVCDDANACARARTNPLIVAPRLGVHGQL